MSTTLIDLLRVFADPGVPAGGGGDAATLNGSAGTFYLDRDNHTGTDPADEVSYNNVSSGLTAADIQAAVDELDGRIDSIEAGVSTRLLPPVQDIAALKAIDTTTAADFPDKALINVEDIGLYRLDRDSAIAEDLNRIVSPTIGTGRWFKMSASINDHNNLSSIQGGTAGQRNHLTNTELTNLQNTSGTNTGDEVTATESIEGIAEIGTIAEVNAESLDNKIVTPSKLGSWLTNVLGRALTWALKQTFTLAPRFSSTTANQILEVNGSKDLVSAAKDTAYNKAFGTTAGTVLEGDKNAAIVANTAKVTNATHTGEVTGSGLLTVDPTAISNKALVAASGTMEVLVNDAGTLKKVVAGDFLGSSVDITGTLSITSIITPTILAVATHDYSPTGLSTATIIRISSSSNIDLTGLAAQASGRIIYLVNVGANDVKLKNNNVASLAANRFLLRGDATIADNETAQLFYDSVQSRWRMIGRYKN